MKKILITGGAGFIGFHMAKHLLSNDDNQLTLIDNLQRGKMDADFMTLLANKRVTFLEADLTDQAFYGTLPTDFDHVYHFAAVNGTKLFYKIPEEVLRVNVLSLIYMLEWLRSIDRKPAFCFTSSNEAYAGGLGSFNQLPLPTPERVPLVISDTYNPRWSYAGSKLIGEQFVIFYAQAYQIPAVIVRPHNFYGPRAGFDHVLPEWSQKIIKQTDPFVIYGPEETRTFCYITDAVEAMRLLMDSKIVYHHPIETVHIGNTDEISMRDLAEKMFALNGWRPKNIIVEPSPVGSVKRRLGDIRKIKELIGWEPVTPLAEGLLKTFEWYREYFSRVS